MTTIYVDIDKPYASFVRSYEVDNAIATAEMMIDCPFSIRARPSATGRTHFCISTASPISILKQFEIRAALEDDPLRLKLDLQRLAQTNDVAFINRIFDEKFIDGEVKRAGEWIVLHQKPQTTMKPCEE